MTNPRLLPTGTFSLEKTNATYVFVLVQGIVLGLVGMAHGIFAASQGNTPTGGYLLALGIFTVIPNYLATGIAAILVGLSVVIWTLGFIHKKNGPIVFLALSMLLFVVGGGIAQVPFFILTWAASTSINKPSAWWKIVLPENSRKRLGQWWLTIWVCDYLFLFAGIGMWLFLSPPSIAARTPTLTQYILWLFLCIGIVFQPLTILSGFAHDIELQASLPQSNRGPEISQ